MRSRNDQQAGMTFNFSVDSVFVNQRAENSGVETNEFKLLDTTNFLLLDGTDFLLLGT